ncbi:hypothetical protein SAMN00120144_3732 [Hymenobacter roseosalivarius DSM 11622]|uniref:Uncharacterized protein n=1 Tax=Hymenobacter roseosalivarius DSM 11622 TaxID=645990 RepID=A0A1W1VAK0_9BACT|nr:hypothetical protein [Hymenobacter roseosalivarius]SMB90382.1 hypothetical protein SAMN00120144_3732 [Hymenobacter roseosalivarius DSM 11622]
MEATEPPFDPRAGRRMKPRDAARWTRRYRDTPRLPGDKPTLAHYFGKEFLQGLLAEPNCAGLRIYQAIDDSGARRVVLIGVDDQGKDLLPPVKEDGTLPDNGDGVGETPMTCPSICDPNSPLMQ